MADTPNLHLRVNGPVNTKANADAHSAAQFVYDYDANMETIDAAFENVAPLDSPEFTGEPTAPTPPDGDNTTRLATTEFVERAISGGGAVTSVFGRTGDVEAQSGDYSVGEVTGAAPLASPALTGNPTAPTASADDNDTSIATTAFVIGQASDANPVVDGSVTPGTSKKYSRADHVHPTDTTRAPLNSPTLTGVPAAPTPSAADNTTKIATTAFVHSEAPGLAPVQSVAGKTGTVTLVEGDIANLTSDLALKAPLANPTLTGTPAAPSAAADTNTTQIATTAFVIGQAGDTNPVINGTAAPGTSKKYSRADHVHPTDTTRAALASPVFTGDPQAPTPAVDDNDTSIATTAFVNGQNKITINAQTGTSYAILSTDNGKLITFSNASDIAASIAAASGFPTGWYVRLKNIGASTVILTPTTSTVGGGVKLFMPPGSGCLMTHDGTNYILPEENLDTNANGGAYFMPDGTMRPLIGFGGASVVNVDNAVCGILCNLDRAVLVNTINFSVATNTSGSSQTAAVGIYTNTKNLIASSGAKAIATPLAAQTFPSTTITGGYVFLPGTYRACWTVSKATTVTLIASATLIGAGTSATWNGNFTTPLMCFASNQSPSAGDLPTTLGTLTSMLASGDNAGNIPIIFFKT